MLIEAPQNMPAADSSASNTSMSAESSARHDRTPLSSDDAAVVDYLAFHVPDAFITLDPDMICSYARHFHGYKERLQTTAANVQEMLTWRKSVPYQCDDILARPPADRDNFERLYQAGPIGRDGQGRVVVLERIGAIPAKEFCAHFTAEAVVEQSVYNREAAMALNRKVSHEEGRLLQRITPLVDLKGFGWAHLSRDFIHRTRVLIKSLINAYPDSTCGFFVINTPSLFSVLWKVLRPLLDEETAAMVHVLGGPAKYAPALAEMGVVLDADIETAQVSWREAAAEAAPGGRKPPPFVYAEDAIVLRGAANAAGLQQMSQGFASLVAKPSDWLPARAVTLVRRLTGGKLEPAEGCTDDFRSSGGRRSPLSVMQPSVASHQGARGVAGAKQKHTDHANLGVASAPSARHDGAPSTTPNCFVSPMAAREAPTGGGSGTALVICAAGLGAAVIALIARGSK